MCGCRNLRLRQLGALSGNHEWPTSRSLEEKINWYVEFRHLKVLNRTDGDSMEFEWKVFPGFTTLSILEEMQKIMTEIQCEHLSSSKDHLLVNVQRHWLGRTRKHWQMFEEFFWSCELCSQILVWTLVVSGTWDREEMVRNSFWKTRWKLGQDWWTKDDQLCRKRSSYMSCHQRPGKRRIKKQREISLFTSTVAKQTLNWFFPRWLL